MLNRVFWIYVGDNLGLVKGTAGLAGRMVWNI